MCSPCARKGNYMAKTNKMNFRNWCQEMWFEHRAEMEAYGLAVPQNSAEYFKSFKYWLKRQYKEQQK